MLYPVNPYSNPLALADEILPPPRTNDRASSYSPVIPCLETQAEPVSVVDENVHEATIQKPAVTDSTQPTSTATHTTTTANSNEKRRNEPFKSPYSCFKPPRVVLYDYSSNIDCSSPSKYRTNKNNPSLLPLELILIGQGLDDKVVDADVGSEDQTQPPSTLLNPARLLFQSHPLRKEEVHDDNDEIDDDRHRNKKPRITTLRKPFKSPLKIEATSTTTTTTLSDYSKGGLDSNQSPLPPPTLQNLAVLRTQLERRLLLLQQARKYQLASQAHHKQEQEQEEETSASETVGTIQQQDSLPRKFNTDCNEDLKLLCDQWLGAGRSVAEVLWSRYGDLFMDGGRGSSSSLSSFGYSSMGNYHEKSLSWGLDVFHPQLNEGESSSWGWSKNSSFPTQNFSFSAEMNPPSMLFEGGNHEYKTRIREEAKRLGMSYDDFVFSLREEQRKEEDKFQNAEELFNHLFKKFAKTRNETSTTSAQEMNCSTSSEGVNDEVENEVKALKKRITLGGHHSSKVDDKENEGEEEELERKKEEENSGYPGFDVSHPSHSDSGEEERWSLGKMLQKIGVDPRLLGWNDEAQEFTD